jgi:UDP-3-O-[3-hydroxymyristoyl] glucosamine N-acyltransferase
VGRGAHVGYPCVLGSPRGFPGEGAQVDIGERAQIDAFARIYGGASIGADAFVGSYSLIREFSIVGPESYILPGSLVHAEVRIGRGCRISGFLCNRAIVEDGAAVMGQLVHRFEDRTPGAVEASPTIKAGAVVAMGAMIVGGVTIHEGAFVSAGATVTRDVGPGERVSRHSDRR